MYMVDIRLISKSEKELQTLIHEVRIYSQDVGMEFGLEKCATLVMKSGRWHLSDGMERENQDKIITLGKKGNLQILGHLGGRHHQTSGDKRKN